MSQKPNAHFLKPVPPKLLGRKHYITKKFPKFTPQTLNTSTDSSQNKTSNKVIYDLSEIDKATDRAWYDQEESGVSDDFHFINNIMGFSSEQIKKAKEEGFTELKQKKLQLSKPLNKKKANLIDTNKWELNRMITSGVVDKTNYNYRLYDDDDEEENKLLIQVNNNVKPKFLSGYTISSKENQNIEIEKDPMSDISRMAKRGSNILRYKVNLI